MNILNRLQNRLDDIVKAKGDPPWVERIVMDGGILASLICMPPGNTSRRHYHPDDDEFWVVMGGELVWEIEGQEPMQAETGDIMRVPKGLAHNIRTVGDGPSLRLAIGVPDIPHIDAETGEAF
jgi:quercetin dioxygenase-like cupin family protein